MSVYVCEYKILNDTKTRDVCMTLFGGMNENDDLNELGNVKLLGRWSKVGEASGFCVIESSDVKSIQKWLNNWVKMADIKVHPCLDDNQQRTLLLNKDPSFNAIYNSINNSPKQNESLYIVKYKFKEGRKEEGFKAFANMSEEMDKMDSGNCTPYGRWHVPSLGYGYAIASSPSVNDMYKWAYNWNELCDCEIIPVTNDIDTREIIRNSHGFEEKYNKIISELGIEKDGPCFISAKFKFKTKEFMEEFINILKGDNGLKVTRNWPGCVSIECFESTDENNEFIIRQEWKKKSDHDKYMNMRKESGLFTQVTAMLETPLEITHLKTTNY